MMLFGNSPTMSLLVSTPNAVRAEQPYLAFLEQVARRTARLVAQWQGVGFCHGVLNTDNMSILGITIDYGPFGFMDSFDGSYICNHSDVNGRYAYNMQPQIAHWNLYALGQALVALTDDVDATKAAIDSYVAEYAQAIRRRLPRQARASTQQADDESLIAAVMNLLQATHSDWTIFWRALSTLKVDGSDKVRDLIVDRAAFDEWAGRYRARLRAESSVDDARAQRMNRVNPKYILRNHLAEVAIRRARGRRRCSRFR